MFVADDMIVKTLLPYRKAKLFGNDTLQMLDHVRYRRGEHCSPVVIGTYTQQQVDMIGHDDIFFGNSGRVALGQAQNSLLDCLPVWR